MLIYLQHIGGNLLKYNLLQIPRREKNPIKRFVICNLYSTYLIT